MAEVKYIIFGLGEQKYGIKLSRINGIEQTYSIVPVPKGADYIKGIIHLRKEVVPVYNLKERFKLYEGLEGNNRQLLVTETQGIKLGIEVDEVVGIVAIPEEDIKQIPNVACNENNDYLENIIKVNIADVSGIVLSVNIDDLMSESELSKVKDVIEQTEQSA